MSDDEFSATALVRAGIEGAAAAAPLGLQASLAGAGIAIGVEGAKQTASVVLGLIQNGDQRLNECLAAEQRAALEELIPEIARRLRDLQESQTDQTAMLGNIIAIFSNWQRVWQRCVDAKKRRILMAALVNAFDKDAYEEGITATLFQIVNELDYPEVQLLGAILDQGGVNNTFVVGSFSRTTGSLARWYLQRLEAKGLVRRLDPNERDQAGLKEPLGSGVKRTELGNRVLTFIRGGLPDLNDASGSE